MQTQPETIRELDAGILVTVYGEVINGSDGPWLARIIGDYEVDQYGVARYPVQFNHVETRLCDPWQLMPVKLRNNKERLNYIKLVR